MRRGITRKRCQGITGKLCQSKTRKRFELRYNMNNVSRYHMKGVKVCKGKYYHERTGSQNNKSGLGLETGIIRSYNTSLQVQSLALPAHTAVHSSQVQSLALPAHTAVHSSQGHFFGRFPNGVPLSLFLVQPELARLVRLLWNPNRVARSGICLKSPQVHRSSPVEMHLVG
jgi:hypothetical protein